MQFDTLFFRWYRSMYRKLCMHTTLRESEIETHTNTCKHCPRDPIPAVFICRMVQYLGGTDKYETPLPTTPAAASQISLT